MIAGVDLAHMRRFRDHEPITDSFLRWVESEDQELVGRLAALDAPGFFPRGRQRPGQTPYLRLFTTLFVDSSARGRKGQSSQIQPSVHTRNRLGGDVYEFDLPVVDF